VAKALVAELLKDLDLLPAPVAESTTKLPRASNDAVAPLAEEPRSRPKNGTSRKRKEEQTDKLVSITEMLLNELITWKEMNDEKSSEERQVLELRWRLTRSEEALRFKGTT
jgi:hypothetical protein